MDPQKSRTVLVRPVSGKRAVVSYDSGDQDGTFVPTGEASDLPMWWGSIALSMVVPNPEIEEVKSARRVEVDETIKTIEAAAADASVPEAQRSVLKAELASGKAKKHAKRLAVENHPLPDEDTVLVCLRLSVLSDEAMATAIRVLREAGFPIVLGPEAPKAEVPKVEAPATPKAKVPAPEIVP